MTEAIITVTTNQFQINHKLQFEWLLEFINNFVHMFIHFHQQIVDFIAFNSFNQMLLSDFKIRFCELVQTRIKMLFLVKFLSMKGKFDRFNDINQNPKRLT